MPTFSFPRLKSMRLKPIFASAVLAVFVLSLCPGEAAAFWPFPKKKVPAVVGAEPTGLTLRRAFELSLENAEVIAIEQEKLNEVAARFYTALDEVTPNVNFLLSESWQDTPSKEEAGSASVSDGASRNLQRRTTPESKFVFSQSLFKGFRELAAINASGADKRRQTALLRQAKLLLFLEVSQAYYNLREARQNLVILREQKKTLGTRITDLDERVKLGRSRNSELETTRADLKLLEADAAEEHRLEVVSAQLLAFYTGLDTIGELDDAFPDLRLEEDPAPYVEKAAERADVLAAKEFFLLSKEDTTIARGAFLPSVSVDGSYYTRRVGFQSGNDWDIMGVVNIPVFEGAGPIGDLKAAKARQRQAELEYKRVDRFARVEIRNAYETLVAWIAQEKALRDARDAAMENYKIQNDEYGLSLVNNLQVLDAFRQSQDVALRWSRSYHEVKRKYWEFRAAQGESILQDAPDNPDVATGQNLTDPKNS